MEKSAAIYAALREERKRPLVDPTPCLVVSVHGAGGACTTVCSWLAGWRHHYGLTVLVAMWSAWLKVPTCTSQLTITSGGFTLHVGL